MNPDAPAGAMNEVTCNILRTSKSIRSFLAAEKPLGYLIAAVSKELSKPKRKDERLLEGAAAIEPDGSVGAVPTRDPRAQDPAVLAETRDLFHRAKLVMTEIEQSRPPVVSMTYLEGAADAEIGEKLELSLENVRFRRWSDLKKLKDEMRSA